MEVLYVVISYSDFMPKHYIDEDRDIMPQFDEKLQFDPLKIIRKSQYNDIRLIGIYSTKEKAEQVKKSILGNSTIKTTVKILSWKGDLYQM